MIDTQAATQLPLIVIVLPIYNGARWLGEQLDSIIAQTHGRWLLLLRDDGSTDNSNDLIAQYALMDSERIKVTQDDRGNLGAAASFSLLMEKALTIVESTPEPAYVALADQDDVWAPEKLAVCLQRMQTEEQLAAATSAERETPVLIHSDLRVVDSAGQVLAESLLNYQGLDADRHDFSAQLLSNTVTGCTALLNRALLRQALPVPTGAMMHDWWLSLVASRFGRLRCVDQVLVDYRQHGANTIGARQHTPGSLSWKTFLKLFQLRKSAQAQALFEGSAAQALAFEQRFADQLNEADRTLLKQVQRMPDLGLWRQRLMFRQLRR